MCWVSLAPVAQQGQEEAQPGDKVTLLGLRGPELPHPARCEDGDGDQVQVARPWCVCVLSRQDIPTGADSCVTSLSCDSHRSLIVAGLGDGSIRVFDRRMALSEW